MNRIEKKTFVFAVTSLLSAVAWGHHSSAIYDLETVLTLSGVVAEYDWANPHVYIYLEAPDSSGQTVVWEIEALPIAGMRRHGWSEDSLSAGDRVTAQLNPHKNANKHAGLGVTVTMRDGKVARVNGPPAAEEIVPVYAATSLSGIWLPSGEDVPHFLALENGPNDWPLTEKGRRAVADFSVTDDEVAMNCTPYAAPYSMLWPLATKLDVKGDTVSIRFAVTGDDERIVHMNVRSHDDAPYTVLGHSIGTWDGDTLVVNTANFLDHPEGNASRLASGSQKHVTESFELAEDRTRLTYRYVLDDPEYLTEPVEGSEIWTYRPDLEYAVPPCDVENARRYLE